MKKLPSLTLEDFIRDIGEIPLCGCDECQKTGTKVNIKLTRRGYRDYKRMGYPKLIRGHKTRQWREQHSKRMTKELHPNYKPEVHNRIIDDCIRDLGEPPVCKCDECQKTGRRVNIDPERYNEYKNHGYPSYINGHYNPMSYPEIVDKVRSKLMGRSFSEETVKKQSIAKKLWFETHEHPRGMKGKHHKQSTINKIIESNSGSKNKNYNPNVHKSIEEIIQDFGEIPLCQCDTNNGQGCGQKIKLDPKKYEEYKIYGYPKCVMGHMSRGKNNPMYGKQAPHPKKIFPHITPFQGLILMHRWDRKLAQYYDSIGELYIYESRSFEMIIDGKNVSYTPDFYLPLQDKFIEVKGYWRRDAKLKSDNFRENFCKRWSYEVLMGKDLKNLGINLRMSSDEQKIIDEYNERKK